MLAEVLLACSLLTPTTQEITPQQLMSYVNCKNRNEIIIAMEEYIPLFSQYFKQEDLETALRISWCESRGKPNAVGVNKDGSKDVGLWQFNDNTWAWLKPKLKITSDRTDTKVSTAVASWLFYNDGSHHWKPSKFCWKY